MIANDAKRSSVVNEQEHLRNARMMNFLPPAVWERNSRGGTQDRNEWSRILADQVTMQTPIRRLGREFLWVKITKYFGHSECARFKFV